MIRHWFDSNIYIQAENHHYGFEIAPGFWTWLESSAKQGLIASPVKVFEELKDYNDHLSRWVKAKRSTGLFVESPAAVQARVREINTYVFSTYAPVYATKFLAKADPFVIAHAWDANEIVATHETLSDLNMASKNLIESEVKIPNVCRHFNVQYCAPFAALRSLGLRLTLEEETSVARGR